MTSRRFLYVLFCGLLAFAGFYGARAMLLREPIRFGASAVPETLGHGRLIAGYLITVAGVALGSIYRDLQRRRRAGQTRIGSVPAFLRSVFRSIDFWVGICGSPLLYAFLLKSIEGASDAALSTLALQNGFCCSFVVDSLLKQSAGAEAPAPPPAG